MEKVYKYSSYGGSVWRGKGANKYIYNPQGVYRVSHNHIVSEEDGSNSERHAERSIYPVSGQQDSPYFIEISSSKVRNDFKTIVVLCTDYEVSKMCLFIIMVEEVPD